MVYLLHIYRSEAICQRFLYFFSFITWLYGWKIYEKSFKDYLRNLMGRIWRSSTAKGSTTSPRLDLTKSDFLEFFENFVGTATSRTFLKLLKLLRNFLRPVLLILSHIEKSNLIDIPYFFKVFLLKIIVLWVLMNSNSSLVKSWLQLTRARKI